METTLAILMALGIFVVIPAVIGFAIVGVYALGGRRAGAERHAEALGKTQIQPA